MPKLHVIFPDGTEANHELTDNLITVGRISDNALQIEDDSVSSHHAELIRDGENYILRDLDSTNGTRYNGEQVGPKVDRPLKPGDRIRFGSVEVLYASELTEGEEPLTLPVESELAVVPAESSVRPDGFSNASPFTTKQKKRDPAGMAVYALAALAIATFAGAVAMVMQMKSPL